MAVKKKHGRRRAVAPKRHDQTAKNLGTVLLTGSMLLAITSPALAVDDGIYSNDRTVSASKKVFDAASDFLSAVKRNDPVKADPNVKLSFEMPKVTAEAGPETKQKEFERQVEAKKKEIELQNAAADAKALAYVKSLPPTGSTQAYKPEDVKVEAPSTPAKEGVTPSKLLASPLKDLVPTSPFGVRVSPITGAVGEFHRGQDYSAACGTDVFAAAGGTVIYSQWHPYGGGNRVEIDHGNGLITTYNHLSSSLVKVGQKVERGEKIALSGTTGASTGCHLHFEVEVNKNVVNPLPWLS